MIAALQVLFFFAASFIILNKRFVSGSLDVSLTSAVDFLNFSPRLASIFSSKGSAKHFEQR